MIEKRYKAEAFDKMQYFYGTAHEPLIHCLIRFTGHIDADALKKAVTLSTDMVPILRSTFVAGKWRAYWKDRGFSGEDIVKVVDENAYDMQLLAHTIDISKEPQLKIFLNRGRTNDTLCLIMNHMVCDGAGFKEYVYLLSGLYGKCKANAGDLSIAGAYPRGIDILLKAFGLRERLKILFSKSELEKQKQKLVYPLEGDTTNPLFLHLDITGGDVEAVKAYAKQKHVTVNDVFLAAYISVFHKETGEPRIVMPCPVDLRKYLKPGAMQGVSNLTSNYICDIDLTGNHSFEYTLEQVSGQMLRQKSDYTCLKPVLLFDFITRILPFGLLEKLFHKTFTIPVASFSNLGIIDAQKMDFGGVTATDAYLTGAVKYVPYFQLTVSTFKDSFTVSSNVYGTAADGAKISRFLEKVRMELAEAVNGYENN